MACGFDLADLLEHQLDDRDCLSHLLRRDHQGRGETDDVAMRLLGEKARVAKRQADVPGLEPLFENDCVEKALAAHLLDLRAPRFGDLLAEYPAEPLRVLLEPFLFEHLEGGDADGARQGVAAKGRSVSARSKDLHDLVIGDDGRYGEDAAAERLAEAHDVGAGVFVLPGEALARPAEAGLDLVADEEHLVPGTDFADLPQIACGRNVDAGFALDGLDDDGDRVGSDALRDGVGVAVGDLREAGQVRPVIDERIWVGRHRDDGDRPTVEIVLGADDVLGPILDAFDLDAPAARGLERGLDRLGACIHREGHLVAGELAELFEEGAHTIVVESSARERATVELIADRIDDFRMPVALVDRRVGGEKIKVTLALRVMDLAPLRLRDDDGQRVVVVGAVFLIQGNIILGFHRRTSSSLKLVRGV